MNQTIAIGPQFFRNERKAYRNWKLAFIREALQNSSDSKNCRNIYFDIEDDKITITDDGDGMTKDILLNVFLILGETSKSSNDGLCGGFGIARTLLCFASDSYKITSQNYICEGKGSSYTVRENSFYNGCKFEIHTGDSNDWKSLVTTVVGMCNVPQTIYLNGNEVSQYKESLTFNRSLSFGDIFTSSGKSKELIVRSNGIWMYNYYIDSPKQVVLEVKNAKEVLSSNRDGIKYPASSELDKFTAEVSREKLSVFKVKNYRKTLTVKPGGHFSARKKRVEMESQNCYFKDYAKSPNIDDPSFDLKSFIKANNPGHKCAQIDDFIKNSISINEVNDPKYGMMFDRFNPVYLTETTNRYKLLKIWYLCLVEIIDFYVEKTGNEFSWGLGWIFSEYDEAQCVREEGIIYFLLNPVDANVNIKFSVSLKEDILHIFCLAMHEVCHVGGGHDEIFANVLTDLTIAMAPKMNDIVSRIKKSI